MSSPKLKTISVLVAGVAALTSLTGCTSPVAEVAETHAPVAAPEVETSDANNQVVASAAVEPKCNEMTLQSNVPHPHDFGERPHATGIVESDVDGKPKTYTVATDDVGSVIAERFCSTEMWVRDIHPGDIISIGG